MSDHGYVYAFAHKPNGWIKIGMTEKNDPAHCWGRIGHYIKQHRLPNDGWELVSFIATPKARELETKIHRSLKKFRVAREGALTELFHCSVDTYIATLNSLEDFIEEKQSGSARPETEAERIAREANYIRSEQARIWKLVDNQWLVHGDPNPDLTAMLGHKATRQKEFDRLWAEHPIGKAQRENQRANAEILRKERLKCDEEERKQFLAAAKAQTEQAEQTKLVIPARGSWLLKRMTIVTTILVGLIAIAIRSNASPALSGILLLAIAIAGMGTSVVALGVLKNKLTVRLGETRAEWIALGTLLSAPFALAGIGTAVAFTVKAFTH